MFKGECCSDLTQDQKFILENVLPVNRKYKVQKCNIIKESVFEELDTKFTATVLLTFNKDKEEI